MVSLKAVRESNAALSSTVSGQVALFVGATSGIALQTLTEYARHSDRPTAYIVGRNQAKLSRVIADLEQINPQGRYVPILAEVSLLKNVDAACAEFRAQEKRLDLLVMAPGYLKVTRQGTTPPPAAAAADNADGLEDTISLRYYVRMRFMQQLLPLLSAASGPAAGARILNIHGAGYEGRMQEDDLELQHSFSLMAAVTHTATMNTLAMAELAPGYPSVSFVHTYPGLVVTGTFDHMAEHWAAPWRFLLLRVALPLLKPFAVPLHESGERQLFHATSARYPPPGTVKDPAAAAAGVPMPAGLEVAVGADSRPGSGCYLLGADGEPVGDRKLLDDYRARGMGKTVWDHTLAVYERVLGPSIA
ncbi:MAG: hypothetical protein M1826_000989 [Phylliscum demangeonii]|nr:MAG: hypothetical protein M1826_000989 [Phylliscum demangeonii]